MKNQIYCSDTLRDEAEKIAFDSLFNLLPVNFTWIDKEGRVLGCNDKVLKCLKINSFNDIFGKLSKELFLNGASENTQRVLKTGEALISDEEHHAPDGTITYFLSIKSPIRSDGKIVGLVNIAVDISDRKQLEEELTKEKAALELADKIKTEFLSSMRHDLRTPLSAICNIVELLDKKETDSEKKGYLKDIRFCTESILGQLNNILDHVKIETGELEVIEQKFNLSELLERIYKVLIPEAENKNLDFKISSNINLPSCLYGDPVRTERVLMNVISNSIKFTEKGFVRVALDWISLEEGKGVAQFTIEDSGIGIPEDKFEHIFEQFTRLTDATQGTYPGTGLGLNIVKRFLSDIDGRYDVISELGKGSKFNICIPYKIPVIKANKPKKGVKRRVNKILLVEDHPVISKMCKVMLEDLEELNCKVDLATSGQAALELIEANIYDLVLLDIGLPDIEGNVVAKCIRDHENPDVSEVPIVAVTAHTEDEQARKCLDSGIQEIIIKPLSSDIARRFSRYLS